MLSEEVETLSTKNERLLSDLKTKEFFDSYNAVLEELQELKRSHAHLIQTMAIEPKGSKSRTSTRRVSVQMPQANIMQPSLIPGGPGTRHGGSTAASNLFSFISCQGCTGANTVMGGKSSSLGYEMDNQAQQQEEFEAIVDR